MSKHDKPKPASRIAKLSLIGLGVLVVVMTGLLLRGLRGGSSHGTTTRSGPSQGGLAAAPAGASLSGADPSLASSEAGARPTAVSGDSPTLRIPTPVPPEPQPWESTPATTPRPAPGFAPAWAVNPTHDEPRVPPAPVEPANPIANRPGALNPGGFEGNRGPVPQAVTRRRANDRSSAGVRPDPGEPRVRLKPDN